MRPSANDNSDNQFVVDLLTTLRHERFSPLGWWHFLGRSWQMSLATAHDNPALKRSWQLTTLAISLLAIAILAASFAFEGAGIALRLLPAFIFCIIWQQSDLFWHLGLSRRPHTGELAQSVGAANTFTLLRGVCSSLLIARIVGGLATPTWLALGVFLLGVATDILDGWLARFTHTYSKLGQIMDAEADFCLYLAITLILIQNAILPLWLGLAMLLRFCLPLVAALGSYFLFSHTLRFGSTIWGKFAGLAQCLYFLVLLAPPQLSFITSILNLPLLMTTLLLLVAAPIAQLIKHSRTA